MFGISWREEDGAMFNNRELSILIWTALFVAGCLAAKGVRHAIPGLLRLALGPQLRTLFAAMALYIGGMVYGLHHVDVLGRSQVFETLFWTLGTAIGAVFNHEQVLLGERFFRRWLLSSLQLAVLIEFVANIYAFGLGVELVLVPVATILVLLVTVAAMKPEHAQVKSLFDGVTAAFGFGLLGFALIRTVDDPRAAFNADNLRDFSTPVLLSVGFLPFVCAVAILAAYGSAFSRINGLGDDIPPSKNRRRAKLILVKSFGLKGRLLKRFTFYWQGRLVAAGSWTEATEVIHDYRADVRRRDLADLVAARTEVEYQQRLVQFAGVSGVDEDGRQLDRREFRETTAALEYLANCQMGWYNNQGRHYHADLIERFSDDFTSQGLSIPSEIKMKVAKRGQSWFAWRKTPGGHVFAIGASGPPPSQWKYDGRTPPSSFPEKDQAWGARPFDDAASPNW
jgi:hypothetical protein